MRILSQDKGKYDLPYENIVLEKMMDCNTIYAYTGTGQPFKMAVYSSTERMDKAMEILRNAYSPKIEIKEPIQKEMPKMRSGDWIWTVSEPKVEVLDNFYFQFPQDSEMEV